MTEGEVTYGMGGGRIRLKRMVAELQAEVERLKRALSREKKKAKES